MAKEHDIVSYINTTMRAAQFSSKRFQKGVFHGIAELVKANKEGETMPGTVDRAGEVTKLSINDIYTIQFYHRVLKFNPENFEQDDYGNRKTIRDSTDMLLVCIGNRTALNLTQEEIITGVTAGMPLEITAALISSLSLVDCEIAITGVNSDKVSVYNSEYNISEYLLKPQTIMFSVNYQIITEFDKTCLTICD